MQDHFILEELQQYEPYDIQEGSHVGATISFMMENTDCFDRSNLHGHVTGSGWIVDPDYKKCLLVHHRKLDRWLQPGGHADGNPDIRQVAAAEVREETGLQEFLQVPGIFDVDVHRIPAKDSIPEHYHFDIRYLFIADPSLPLQISDESHNARWIDLDDLPKYTRGAQSIQRMAEKSRRLPGAYQQN